MEKQYDESLGAVHTHTHTHTYALNKIIRKKNGITLIALVITIIVLLILSGITIQSITNKGIISNAKRAELENKRAQISETLQLRLITEQSNNPFGNSEEIISATRESVIENIDEIKQLGKDVTVEEISTEENFEKVDDYFYVVVDDDIYKVEQDGVKFIGKTSEMSPAIRVKAISAKLNSITVQVATQRNEGGKLEYYIKKDSDEDYKLSKTITDQNYTYDGLEEDTKYSIKIVAVAKNKKTAEVVVEKNTKKPVADLTEANAKFAYSPSGWTNTNVVATASTDVTGYTIQTSLDGKTWTSTSSQTLTSNGKVYARLWDGEDAGGMLTGNVTAIDKVAPVINTNLNISNVTTKSLTLNITTTDANSGLGKIIWYYKKSTESSYKNIEQVYTQLNGKTAGATTQTTKTYTLDNLSSGTYDVYAEIYDVAGNRTTSTVVNTTLAVIAVNNYNGVYDGSAHTATLSSNIQGTTFKYGTTNGSYTLSSIPTYTNAGTYTIYWQASKGYVIATGSATVKIEKANSTISLSASNGYITVTSNSDGSVSATSSNTGIANVPVTGRSIRIVPVTNGGSGTFTVSVVVNESTNYKASSTATQSVTVSSRLITSSIGWYETNGYWSGYFQLSGSSVAWVKDTSTMWHTTGNIALSSGCYYVIGGSGTAPRAVLWNNTNQSGYYSAFQTNDGVTISFTGTKYLQMPILVSGSSGGTPAGYTSYDVRKITFN